MSSRHASVVEAKQIQNSEHVHQRNGSDTSIAAPSTGVMNSPTYSNTTHDSTSTTPQEKATLVLVDELRNKLPCYSGITLPDLETDQAVQQTVESLVDIARESLDIVARNLTELLEKLHENTNAIESRTVEVQQSQLFLLKILSTTMACGWKRTAEGGRSSSGPDSSAGTEHHERLDHRASYKQSGFMPPWVEPPPLDEACARYVLNAMVMFIRQAAPPQQHLTSAASLGFRDPESNDISSIPTAAMFPQHSTSYEHTSSVLCSSSESMNALIAKFSGKVVYHLSALNWPVVFSRIKSIIRILASTREELADTLDMQLIAQCWLDKDRLLQLFQDLPSLLGNMRQDIQIAVASSLRTLVWNWIESHHEEFEDAQRHYGILQGTPGRVFNLLYQLVNTPNEAAVWPALTIFMCISNDRIRSEYNLHAKGITTAYNRQNRGFLQVLIQTMSRQSEVSEIAMMCILDICRAASRIQPGDEVPLQAMASDLAHEVKMILVSKWGGSSNAPKAFWESSDKINVALIADALVTLFRFLPLSESMPIIMHAFQPEMSHAVKTSAIKACIILIVESPRVPLRKPLDDLKEQVSPRLHGIFHSLITRRSEISSNGVVNKVNYQPKAKRYTTGTHSDRKLVIHAIIALWHADVSWFLDGLDLTNMSNWIPQTIMQLQTQTDFSIKYDIARAIRHIQEDIRDSPMDSLVFINGSEWIMHYSAETMASFGMALLTCPLDFRNQRVWMDMANEHLNWFTRTMTKEVPTSKIAQERKSALALAEIAFMVTLTSAERSVSTSAAQCLRSIASAERQYSISEEDKNKRYAVYKQLGDPRSITLDRVLEQKRIRKLMRILAIPTPAYIAVWQECYWRWRELTEMGGHSFMDPVKEERSMPIGDNWLTTEERQAQCYHLTLFLTSFGATCLTDNHNPSALVLAISSPYLPTSLRTLHDSKAMLESLISYLIDLLLVDGSQTQDLVREALSSEAHPKVYPTILRRFSEVFNGIIGQHVVYDHLNAFLDQFIIILKIIIENAPSVEELKGLDIMATLFQIAQFVTRMTDRPTYHLKAKFCALCDTYLGRSDLSLAGKDMSMRIAIADYVMEWAQDPTSISDVELARTLHEVNDAALRTSIKLFDQLDLKSVDQGDPGHNVISPAVHYANFLFKLLPHLDAAVNSSLSARLTSNDFKPGRTIYRNRPVFFQSRITAADTDLGELIMNGFASLLSANVDIDIKRCLPLTYDADPAKRVAFARTFSRVLARGAKLVPRETQATVIKQSGLCELIKTSDTGLALAICQVCPSEEVDQIINVLLNLFDTRSALMNLLKAAIDKEIASTNNGSSPFRKKSICTRILSAFARIYGYNYLRNLIQPLIKTISEIPPGHAYDLDPSKAPSENYEQNKRDLIAVATVFLETVSASAPAVPSMFREICAHIDRAMSEIWPEATFQALGAFVFLHFISPAISNPGVVDLEAPVGPMLRRGLMNIAKIVQNLANNIPFSREVHMTPLNDFLRDNIGNVTQYLGEIKKFVPTEDRRDEWLDTPFDKTDAIFLRRILDEHAHRVGKELLSNTQRNGDGDGELASRAAKTLWNSMCTALVETDQAPIIPVRSELSSEQHIEYNILMQRYYHRGTTSLEHLFAPAVTRNDGVAVFVLSISKIDVEALDIEHLLYFIFKTLTSVPYQGRDFDMIFDWTGFASGSQIPVHWLKIAYELVPMDVCKRFKMARMLMPNASALKYMRRIYNLTRGVALSEGFTTHMSISELLRNYPEGTSLPSLQYTFEREDELGQNFDDVYMSHHQSMRIPVMLRVTAAHLRITTLKATLISDTLSSRATEIFHLDEISDALSHSVSTNGHMAHDFIIRKTLHDSTLHFTSVDAVAIVKSIRSAKDKMKSAQTSCLDGFKTLPNVAISLLQIGLVNISSVSEELCVASYELLSSVCTYLNFEGKPVIPTKAVFIPGRTNAFVLQLSEKLAAYAPQLTLEFIEEVADGNGTDKALVTQRITCLQYMSPWVRNLPELADPASRFYEHPGIKVRSCIHCLIDLTVGDQAIRSAGQEYIWRQIGRADNEFVNVAVDELMRAAVDNGIASQRCETVAEIISTWRSTHATERVLGRIRKAIGKVSQLSTVVLPDDPCWSELACLIRLTSRLTTNFLTDNSTRSHIFIPECTHIVSLVAGTGQLFTRISVYDMFVHQVHAAHLAQSSAEEENGVSEIRALQDELTGPDTLQLFGLARVPATSDYAIYDHPYRRQCLEVFELLSHLLDRVLQTLAGSLKGVLGIWRTQWMEYLRTSAFQVPPAIQVRMFVTLGNLASSDVDDNLLSEMVGALKVDFLKLNDSVCDPMVTASMLRCARKVVVATHPRSRYLSQLFWLAVAFIQSGNIILYTEAIQLLPILLERMHSQRWFKDRGVVFVLLQGQTGLEEVTRQIENISNLSFESDISFTLAAIIFKGIRHIEVKEHAEEALRTLLRITVQSCVKHDHSRDGIGTTICSDALGFFIALLPSSTSNNSFKRTLEEAQAGRSWFADLIALLPLSASYSSFVLLPEDVQDQRLHFIGEVVRDQDDPLSLIPFSLLGVHDDISAVYVAAFTTAIIDSAQGNDTETVLLFNIMLDIANHYPNAISAIFECLQEKTHDVLSKTSNAAVLAAASDIFRISTGSPRHSSSSSSSASLPGNDGAPTGRPGPRIQALDKYGMGGLVGIFGFAHDSEL